MEITFDLETIRIINLFEKITGVQIKDCIIDQDTKTIFFVVNEGKIQIAIGKNGSTVKHMEKLLKHKVKIFEYSSNLSSFVKNLIPQSQEVKIKTDNNGTSVEVKVDKKDKAIVIGRDERNLKIYREILQRSYNVNNLIVR